MPDRTIYDEPSEVDAEDGTVTVHGPDAVDVRLTPEAAEETSERLNTGAMKARGQRFFSDQKKWKRAAKAALMDSALNGFGR